MTNRVRRITGIGVGGSLALALLAGGCVLAATAGPRQVVAAGTRELRTTVARAGSAASALVVSTDPAAIDNALGSTGMSNDDLTSEGLNEATTQFRRDFSGGAVRLAPATTDWVAMTSDPRVVTTSLSALRGINAKVEVSYRSPVAEHMRLVVGDMPQGDREAPANGTMPFTELGPFSGIDLPPPNVTSVTDLQVVVTLRTARVFGLRVGSQALISLGQLNGNGPGSQLFLVRLHVTGIVEPTDPDSAFWTADPLLAAPALVNVNHALLWEGAFIADPGEGVLVQQLFGQTELNIQWQLPVDGTSLGSQPAPFLYRLNQVTGQVPHLTGNLARMSGALSVSSGLTAPLTPVVNTSNAVNVLLWMLYMGLLAAGVAAVLLAAWVHVARRSAEFAVRRARGASLRQLASFASLGAAVACVPAAGIALAIAVLLIPDAAPAGPAAWWPGAATLLVAVAGPGVIAAWRYRVPRRRRARWRGRWLPRLVVEVTACAAAAAGVIVFRRQPGATDLYTSAAPVLVTIPAVVLVLRLCPLLLRSLARASARQRGVIGLVGLARAAGASAALALPAMTLILAITMTAFTGMVREGMLRTEITASWQSVGADVVIAAPNTATGISAAAVRAITAVPGVQHAATALEMPLTSGDRGELVTGIVVDPGSYAALTGSTEGFPRINPSLLSPSGGASGGAAATAVLVSPRAAAALNVGRGGVVSIPPQDGLAALRVRVAGYVPSTPALPGGGPFIILPMSAIRGPAVPLVNTMLLTGASINMTRLRAAVRVTMPGVNTPSITTRSDVLHALTGTPVQQGTFLLFTLAIGFATALTLAVLLLEQALSAADRDVTLARLATMGLADGQRFRLTVVEVLPAIAAAAAAAIACAIVLPPLVAPAIELSALTQSQAPVPLQPDFASLLLPLAGLGAVAVVALAFEIRSGRGRRVAVSMRG